MDALLRRWQDASVEHDRTVSELSRTAATSPEDDARRNEMMAVSMRKLEESQSAIAAANPAAASAIAACLAENAQAFREAVSAEEYPSLYAPCPVELAVTSLRLNVELDPAQFKAIDDLLESYLPQRADLRKSTLRAIEKWESPAEVERRAALMEQLEAEGGERWTANFGHFAIPILHQRLVLAQQTCAQIRSIVAADFDSLPADAKFLLGWQ